MAPLDALHDAVRRTVAAKTARVRIAHLIQYPAPACTLPKYAELDFEARLALETEPPVTAIGLLGRKILDRWPWLDDGTEPFGEQAEQRLFAGGQMLLREGSETEWRNVGEGSALSPFGIFDRLAIADAAVMRGGLVRFRTPDDRPGFGDLDIDDDGRIRQIVFGWHYGHRSRLPRSFRPGMPWLQVDVLELGSPVAIEVPDPLPPPPPPPEPVSWRDTVAFARRLLALRRTG